eukprot:TRINITY_DN17244_c0_g1_i1.p1 TRINITY_DN17244_c0_g1~~TRINITY_DN17244_c0_g1_i1.p1  ORF type:complete len:370 (+),score=87.84 TRINITY_DN17244_c0_g1_i1:43-1110(+)
MGMGKVFKENTAPINSIDFFHGDGELVVTSSDDETIRVYNVNSASPQRTVYSKKYGVSLTRFTHNNNNVISASKNGWDESLRYLSLHDNKYINYFKGHRDRVVSLSMSPCSDAFMSGSLDNTVRLWDLRSSACQGLLRVSGQPAVSFDPEGIIFGVASGNGAANAVKLYDTRSFDSGPFSVFSVAYPAAFEWSSLQFSPNGRQILLSTSEAVMFLLDAFTGATQHVLHDFFNSCSTVKEPCFSPDSQFVLSGSSNGWIHVWNAATGQQIDTWKGHPGPVGVVRWNPKLMMVVSACTNLAFWVPKHAEQPQSQSQAQPLPPQQPLPLPQQTLPPQPLPTLVAVPPPPPSYPLGVQR